MEKTDFSSLSDDQLKEMLKELKEKDESMRKEVNDTIGILNDKLETSRKETDEALSNAIKILKQSIEERRVRIAELKIQNNSAKQKTTELNDETMQLLAEISSELRVNAISEIAPKIEELKKKKEEELKLQKKIEEKNGNSDSRKEMLLERITKLLNVWSEKSVRLPENSNLNAIFISLRDWLNEMTKSDFTSQSANTVSNDLIEALEAIAGINPQQN